MWRSWTAALLSAHDPVTVLAVVGFGACSSVMLIINKVAITHLPAPGIILFLQCALTAIIIRLAAATGRIVVDPLLSAALLRAFAPVALGFLACLYSNSKALQYLNVESFIVCRNSTPVAICLLDYLFLGRELPSAWSALCIGAMILGGAGYALTDSAFVLSGYAWLAGWMLAFLFDQIYIKHVVESVPVASNWSRAMYTNAWAALFLATIVCASPEERLVFSDAERWTGPASLAVGASCGVAVFISYLSFLARKQLSATAFTVLGNACKILSVLLNVLIWDKHASPIGLCFLCLTLGAAVLYAPAPLRQGYAKLGDHAAEAAARGPLGEGLDADAAYEESALLRECRRSEDAATLSAGR